MRGEVRWSQICIRFDLLLLKHILNQPNRAVFSFSECTPQHETNKLAGYKKLYIAA